MNETIHDEENSSETQDNSIHDEYDTSENENRTDIKTFLQYGEKIHGTEESIPTEISPVLTLFNKAIHHEVLRYLKLSNNQSRPCGIKRFTSHSCLLTHILYCSISNPQWSHGQMGETWANGSSYQYIPELMQYTKPAHETCTKGDVGFQTCTLLINQLYIIFFTLLFNSKSRFYSFIIILRLVK